MTVKAIKLYPWDKPVEGKVASTWLEKKPKKFNIHYQLLSMSILSFDKEKNKNKNSEQSTYIQGFIKLLDGNKLIIFFINYWKKNVFLY